MTFSKQHPHLTTWILQGDGWIELGQDDFSHSTVRVLDSGGLIWESDRHYDTVEDALTDAESALRRWLGEEA